MKKIVRNLWQIHMIYLCKTKIYHLSYKSNKIPEIRSVINSWKCLPFSLIHFFAVYKELVRAEKSLCPTKVSIQFVGQTLGSWNCTDCEDTRRTGVFDVHSSDTFVEIEGKVQKFARGTDKLQKIQWNLDAWGFFGNSRVYIEGIGLFGNNICVRLIRNDHFLIGFRTEISGFRTFITKTTQT